MACVNIIPLCPQEQYQYPQANNHKALWDVLAHPILLLILLKGHNALHNSCVLRGLQRKQWFHHSVEVKHYQAMR